MFDVFYQHNVFFVLLQVHSEKGGSDRFDSGPRQVVTLALSFGLSLNGRGRMDGGNDGGAAHDGRVGLIRPSCTAVFVCQTWSWVLRRLQGVS